MLPNETAAKVPVPKSGAVFGDNLAGDAIGPRHPASEVALRRHRLASFGMYAADLGDPVRQPGRWSLNASGLIAGLLYVVIAVGLVWRYGAANLSLRDRIRG